jgi:integrase
MKPTKINFTKRSIEALPTPREERAIYHDTQVRGLGVLVQPTGYRSFFWFRKVDGRAKWKTIGAFPDMTVEQARARASEYNTSIADWKAHDYEGPSPFKQRNGVTLGEVFEDYLEIYRKDNAKNPDRSIPEERAMFKRHLKQLEDRKLDSLRRDDLTSIHSEIGKEHGHYSANRVIQLVRRVINWAIAEERWHGENPAGAITKFPEKERERFLQPDEVQRLFKELKREKNVDLRDFVYLALFMGARRGNVLAMRWEQLSQTADGQKHWTIPFPKNEKPHVVPLVPEALAVLEQRRRRIKKEKEWVFPSDGKSGHVRDFKRGWKQLLKRAKITNLRIHDLRRTLGSWMASAGISLPIIGAMLGHQSLAATKIYARLQNAPVRDAAMLATRALIASSKKRPKLLEASNG